MPSRLPIYAGKVSDMHTLLKYVKKQQYAKYAAVTCLHKTHIPNYIVIYADRW